MKTRLSLAGGITGGESNYFKTPCFTLTKHMSWYALCRTYYHRCAGDVKMTDGLQTCLVHKRQD